MSCWQKILSGIAHEIHKYAEPFCCLLLKCYWGNICLQQQCVAKEREVAWTQSEGDWVAKHLFARCIFWYRI